MSGRDDIEGVVRGYAADIELPDAGVYSSMDDAYRYVGDVLVTSYLGQNPRQGFVAVRDPQEAQDDRTDERGAVYGSLVQSFEGFIQNTYGDPRGEAERIARQAVETVMDSGSFSAEVRPPEGEAAGRGISYLSYEYVPAVE